VIFTLPSLVLGMISPAMAKMALARSNTVGTTIGSVYAWATVGSIVGTLATGFYLIAALGAQGVVLVIALGLALIGVFLGPYRWVHAIWAVVLVFALFLAKSGWASAYEYGTKVGLREVHYLFDGDSDYQYIKVYEDTSEHDEDRTIRILALDYLIHGYVDMKDPTHLEYGYERIYRDVARRFIGRKKKIATFFIGGGSYTFPRWVLHKWPGSRVDVAEIDPLVLEANHAALGLPRETPIRTFLLDARNALDDLPAGDRYDVIFGDAFNDLSVPWHLTTVEFNRKVAAHLVPDGAYLMNVIDDFKHGLFLGSVVATLEHVFKHVYVFSTEREGVTPGRETFVVAASDRPIRTADWRPGHTGEFEGSLLSASDIRVLERRCNKRVLTDDDAPVENLLAPVVRARK
jgi:spermidine synthase